MTTIYKIIDRTEWARARARGQYDGSADDRQDGFIHFSTAGQVQVTASRHFAGQPDLVLLAVDGDGLGEALRWEPSRGGELFPHLYGVLTPASVVRSWPLPLGEDGRHRFPEDLP
jgi:uncharacterized protein (DUF952 family)